MDIEVTHKRFPRTPDISRYETELCQRLTQRGYEVTISIKKMPDERKFIFDVRFTNDDGELNKYTEGITFEFIKDLKQRHDENPGWNHSPFKQKLLDTIETWLINTICL